jgi:hypothetical protein
MTDIFKVKLVLISFCLLPYFSFAQKLQEEKELETVNFENIKKVLEKDGLAKEVQIKKNKVRKIKQVKEKIERDRFYYPSEKELWGLASEVWLIKNAQILGWDFEKPDYGIEDSFKQVLEKLGFIQKKFKILILNTPSLVRASLPGLDGEIIYVISLPFIRNLDLSKLEISLFLLEDFFRMEANYLQSNFSSQRLSVIAGTNFKGQNPDTAILNELVAHINSRFFDKGFSFQQQFEVTKKMDSFLKSTPDLWGVYYRLLIKIDRFLKTNIQYKTYLKLYPSPEMQVKWLSPEDKVI